ncbi:Transcription factor Iwr1 [Penicillium brevicompactum]|uniref:Transcription factor Iwr1 n=1 Tax=Penicillium brevicompactum TaxID=5074 RepID=A0A9W9QX31_PENBR|nr:Transcription factor Iwr1 [Penicillium brevicompactum]
MALPPEQINIKRRREEEPVETLFIQSAVHQTKRRFTDFVFERVALKASQVTDGSPSPPLPAHPAAQRLLRSPRSVSSLHVNRRAPASSTGVPTVRATSPGAEFREAQRIATARKEAEEKRKHAIYSGPSPFSELPVLPSPGSNASGASRTRSPAPRATSPSRAQALRRFQISRSNLGSLKSTGGGVQKKRAGGPAPGVAVLVEQLQRNPHSRKGSMVSDMIAEGETQSRGLSALSKELVADPVASSPTKPRKRPVVNQAEKRWREQRKGSISTAKQNLSDSMEKSAQIQDRNWDEESDRLAREFEQVALELEQDQEQDYGMDLDSRVGTNPPAPQPQPVLTSLPKTPLKHQPRLPKEPRVVPSPAAPQEVKSEEAVEEDDDEDYVYDVYIRRPISETEMLKNPLAEYESEQQQKVIAKGQPGVGVIVITAEDEQYWEDFVEDDEEEWDSEDADSNAENNPANDYPDEEISSDDDEFDFDDSASEDGGDGYMSRWRGPVDSDDEY